MAQIYQSTRGAFSSLVRCGKIKCHGFAEETYTPRKMSLKGKCRRVNVEYWKACYGVKGGKKKRERTGKGDDEG